MTDVQSAFNLCIKSHTLFHCKQQVGLNVSHVISVEILLSSTVIWNTLIYIKPKVFRLGTPVI
jgi:hypothetical protein